MRVIGAPGYKVEGLDVEAERWRSETEVEDLRPLDIGVMPLPEDRWSRGKCGMKALQYMGLGIATVCSPVGVNSSIIRDGENGLWPPPRTSGSKNSRCFCATPLAPPPRLAGRATVEQTYSAAVQAPASSKSYSPSSATKRERVKGKGKGRQAVALSPSPFPFPLSDVPFYFHTELVSFSR